MSKELIRLTDCVMAFDEDIVLDKINLSIRDKDFYQACNKCVFCIVQYITI